MLVKIIKYHAHHAKFCIIGGGTAGLNLAAHLIRTKVDQRDITIFQPSKYHYYQPAWTMAGFGMVQPQQSRNLMQKVIPDKCHLVKQKVKTINPDKNLVITQRNHQFTYENLIIASGFKLDWDKIKGAKENLQKVTSKVCSIYDYNYLEKTYRLGRTFQGGKAIFTEPPPPIKCAGAPQKILYLWTHEWLRKNLLVDVEFFKSIGVMFSVPKYSEALTKVAKDYKIKTKFKHNLIEIKGENVAVFQNVQTKQKIQKQFNFLHITPPMSPHDYIKESGLANQQGFVDVDKHTLRHLKYSNIWSLGDCSSLPNSKTAAAVFEQTLVLMRNMLQNQDDKTKKKLSKFPQKYDGYASCPLFVGGNKLMLAEFKYDGKVQQSFYSNQQKPSRLFYYMKRYLFPFVYWKLVPRGLWKGRKGIRWY